MTSDAKPGVLAQAREYATCNRQWAPEWVVSPFLQKNGVNLLFGAPKQRKSTLRAHLLACALTGQPIFGTFKPSSPIRRALVCLGEETADAEATRLADTLRGLGQDPAAEHKISILEPGGARLDSSNGVLDLCVEMQQEGVDLIVFDPLVHFHRQDENSAGGMSVVTAALRQLANVATVLVVHHSGKPQANGPARTVGYQARGSSALAGAYDVGLMVEQGKGETQTGQTVHQLRIEARYAPPISPRTVYCLTDPDTGAITWRDGGETDLTEEIQVFMDSYQGWASLNYLVTALGRSRTKLHDALIVLEGAKTMEQRTRHGRGGGVEWRSNRREV